MLVAGWEVRIVKNCDRGLENAADDFQVRGHCFSQYGPILSRTITYLPFFQAVNWLTSGFVYAALSLNWLTCRPQTLQTIGKKSNERTSE